MKTKLFTLFLALAASAGTMFADKVQIGDLYYNLDATTQTAEVTSQHGSEWSTTITTANIPSTVEYNSVIYNVTSIGEFAFANCKGLTSVTIPSSVTSIEDYAFAYCSSLTSVIISNGVTNIGQCAFNFCSSLVSINIPNSVTSIEGGAFSNCTSLPVENNLRYADTYLVGAVDKTLSTYTIKNGTKWIGGQAFYYCENLTAITIPNSVTCIGESAFHGCTGLTSVTIPNSVTSIEGGAFSECTSLVSIVVDKGNTIYDSRNCCNAIIETVTNTLIFGCQNTVIPNSVTSITYYAFWGCSGLTSVTIPNSVTSIEEGAFYGCTGLTAVTCYATTPPELGGYVFGEVDCSQISLYVLAGSVNSYQTADQWKDFGTILPITAKDATTNTVKAEPTNNSVEVTWPIVTGAATYELVIKDKSGNVICTLVFNANGQLQSIAFNAPGRNAAQQTQSAGFAFTVTGLDSGTSYDLTITAKNSGGSTLDTQMVSFTTESAQAIDQITNDQSQMTNKIIRDGQVFILRGDKTYTLTGAELK